MTKRVIIIGAGLGGLFTGAILSKEGFQVTIVEKNTTIGGGLQTFQRFGEHFDTGMHVIGGMQPGVTSGRFAVIWTSSMVSSCATSTMTAPIGCISRKIIHFITSPKGVRDLSGSLAQQFPAEREHLEHYVDDVLTMADEVDLFNLRPSKGHIGLLAEREDMLMAADDFIARHITNPRLRSVLAYMNPLYGGRAHETPAYIHAIISALYLRGASRFVGGSNHFAQLLADVVIQHGGQVVTGDGVVWIECRVEGGVRQVEYVKTLGGRVLTADWYISDIHPCTLLGLMREDAFPKSYRERLNSIPNTHSAFSLYIKLKNRSFRYINHSEYYMTRYADVWNFSSTERPWPLGFLLMTPPNEHQDEWATKVLVTAPMPFRLVEHWADTTVGHRGEDYERWKVDRMHELLAQVEDAPSLQRGYRSREHGITADHPRLLWCQGGQHLRLCQELPPHGPLAGPCCHQGAQPVAHRTEQQSARFLRCTPDCSEHL